MSRWALISDEHTQARVECILDVARELRARGVSVGGFIQQRSAPGEGPGGFELVRLAKPGERAVLAQKPAKDGVAVDDAACDYLFDDVAFKRALEWIREDAQSCELLVLDVISKMESYGHGHARSLRTALESGRVVLLGVRASELSAVVDEFQLDTDSVVSWLELPVTEAERSRFVRKLADETTAKA